VLCNRVNEYSCCKTRSQRRRQSAGREFAGRSKKKNAIENGFSSAPSHRHYHDLSRTPARLPCCCITHRAAAVCVSSGMPLALPYSPSCADFACQPVAAACDHKLPTQRGRNAVMDHVPRVKNLRERNHTGLAGEAI
jgi:hypothetical protein